MNRSESAFIVEVPEAEDRVRSIRTRLDPSASLGVPAHITALYPFMPSGLIDESVLSAAEIALSAMPAFAFSLNRVARFPGVLYLAPTPETGFVHLTEALVRQFPEYPPYGGRFGTIVPHLTVAHRTETELSAAQCELSDAMTSLGPIHSVCRKVTLIENSSGVWRSMHTLLLAM